MVLPRARVHHLCALAAITAACPGTGGRREPAPPSPLTTSAHGLEATGTVPTGTVPTGPAPLSPLEKFLAGDRTFGVFTASTTPPTATSPRGTRPRRRSASATRCCCRRRPSWSAPPSPSAR